MANLSTNSEAFGVFIAGAMAWGYVDNTSHTGLVYHWLYSGVSLASQLLGGSSWTSMVAVYLAQYLVVFSLVALAWRVAHRRHKLSFKPTSDGAA
jgi:hypothetical protein